MYNNNSNMYNNNMSRKSVSYVPKQQRYKLGCFNSDIVKRNHS